MNMDIMTLTAMSAEQLQTAEVVCREQLRMLRRVMKLRRIPTYQPSQDNTFGPVVVFMTFRGGNQFFAIKALRALDKAMGLKEAKDIVDGAIAGNAIYDFRRKLTFEEVQTLAPHFTFSNSK